MKENGSYKRKLVLNVSPQTKSSRCAFPNVTLINISLVKENVYLKWQVPRASPRKYFEY